MTQGGPGGGTASTLSEHIRAIEETVRSARGPSDQLAKTLSTAYQMVLATDLGHHPPSAVLAEAAGTNRRLFELRLALRSRVPEWQADGLMTRPVQRTIRDVLRSTRYAGDMMAEIATGFPEMPADATPIPAFQAGSPGLLVAPEFAAIGPLTFEAGDVLLLRGRQHNSAAIARIGDVDSQFSHIGIVHVDRRGRRFVVEALIEDGATVSPLEESLKHGLARAMLFRHRDRELARNAASIMHGIVKRWRLFHGHTIPYDFSMELKRNRRLFCSKLVRLAFDHASKGQVVLPTYPTRLDMQNRDFFKRIGVTAIETFAPADIELESDFDVVAEWADVRTTTQVRLHDLIMTKLFEWMEVHGDTFQETASIRLISLLGRLSAFLSEDAKNLIRNVVPKVPFHMRRKTIAAIAMLHKTAEPLYQELAAMNREQVRNWGLPMHPLAVYAELERIRLNSNGLIGHLAQPSANARR